MKRQIDLDIKPNKILQPLSHKEFRIIGHLLEFNDSNNLKLKENGVVTLWKRYAKKIAAIVGLVILAVVIFGAIFIPFFSSDPRATDLNKKFLAPGEQGYILGTDGLGRDLWSFIWSGLRFSLTLSMFVVLVDICVGVTFGLLMGHFPKFDKCMQYFIKVFVNVPSILILILATITFEPSFWTLAIGFCITGWIGMGLNVRAQVLRAKNFQWITASKFLGTPSWKILRSYVPYVIPLIITQVVLRISGVIVGETSISFIGLGVPNQPSLGSAITSGAAIVLTFPRYVLIPASVLMALTLSLQLISTEIERAIVRQR